jgi:ubiquinol-cytochrome c reductase cytochrome b subunit
MSSMQHSVYTPKTALGRWVDARMPLPRLVYDSFVAYPVPRNLNYAYTFGGILTLMLAGRSRVSLVHLERLQTFRSRSCFKNKELERDK